MGKISVDFGAVNRAALARYSDLLFEWFPSGHLQGKEFRLGNLKGDPGKSLSINVSTGRWADFATGDSGGDPISLYAARFSIEQNEAAQRLAEELGLNVNRGRSVKFSGTVTPIRERQKAKWMPIVPVPDGAPTPKFEHYRYGTATETWAYRSPEGRLLGHIVRFDRGGAKKEILPLTLCRAENCRVMWRWKSFPKPRPLFCLDQLAAQPSAKVLIVEGEKTASAAQRLLPAFVVVTWPGGCKAVRDADFSPLYQRDTFVWPDNDQPGQDAARKVVQILKRTGARSISLVNPPDDACDGWDLADAEVEGWGTVRVEEHIRDTARHLDLEPANQRLGSGNSDPDATKHFRALGYDHDRFHFLTSRGCQVLTFSGRLLRDRSTLLMLAPLDYWTESFPGQRGIDMDKAVDWLFEVGFKAGVFDPKRLRGRGGWWDKGRAVLHLGSRLVVDGKTCSLTEIESGYIYEAGRALHYAPVTPLSDDEAQTFLELCDMLRWERSISGLLLAGWCVLAPISGALCWRPHIWITSPSGAGKSWVMDNIIRRAVGELAIVVQSKTTEAGLRQEIQGDARPVLFDEAEGEDQRSRERMQTVIELARASSSEGGAEIIKGTSSGNVKRYLARSCFAFSSINVLVRHFADESRITVLSLLPPDDGSEELIRANSEHFAKLKNRLEELLTADFASRLLARSVANMSIIRTNAQVFCGVAAEYLGSRRLGDQIGTLLAGAHSLQSRAQVNPEKVREMIARLDFSEYVPRSEELDERRLMSTLLEHMIRFQEASGLACDRAIGELVVAAAGDSGSGESDELADAHLRRLGMRVEKPTRNLLVSNSHSAIARILKETPWAKGWSRALKRLPGATTTKNPTWFGPGAKHRAVCVPLSLITF
ncbi:MAG: hypothetical protein V3U32_02965 [Anaerolineales bacterium]